MAWYLDIEFFMLETIFKCCFQVDHVAALQLAVRGNDMGCLWCKGTLALCYLCGWAVKQDTDYALFLAGESATTGYGQFCLGCVSIIRQRHVVADLPDTSLAATLSTLE
jgi:hypothetical protein